MSALVQASPRTADNIPPHRTVTLLLYVDAPEDQSPDSLAIMKQELRELLNSDATSFDFITPEQAKPPAYFQSLVSVRLLGSCKVDNRNVTEITRGPLAFAHASDGRILPFIEVECDRIRRHVRSALWGPDFDRSPFLYGRALARVLAHELYHVLTGRKQHTTTGLTRKALSGFELISDEFQSEEESLSLISSGFRY